MSLLYNCCKRSSALHKEGNRVDISPHSLFTWQVVTFPNLWEEEKTVVQPKAQIILYLFIRREVGLNTRGQRSACRNLFTAEFVISLADTGACVES